MEEEKEQEEVKEEIFECDKCGFDKYRRAGSCRVCVACGTTDGGCG